MTEINGYIGAWLDLEITLEGVEAGDLSELEWVIDGVAVITDITAVDANGNAIVSIQVDDATTGALGKARYGWQLQGSVNSVGPHVLAEGVLKMKDLFTAL